MAIKGKSQSPGADAGAASPAEARPAAKRQILLAAALIVAATVGVYLNSLDGRFVLDDHDSIVRKPEIRRLWPLGDVLRGPRPVVHLSLAVNYRLGGLHVRGYHAFNLAVHVLAALALFGVVRRTLLTRPVRERFGAAALPLALAAAVLWAVHPLHTGAVTYVIQRAESMMGMFYLLTLYAAIRGFTAQRGRGWFVLAVLACTLGMASKAVMVTAPVMVLACDRIFFGESFRGTFRRRWGLYAALAGTWVVMATRLWAVPTGASAGFAGGAPAMCEYAATQFGVILHYLRMSVWPTGQCLDYWWPPARTAGRILPQAAAVAALLAATVLTLRRKPALGFLGLWFFLILAPTSSIMPIHDRAFEHRMYLPLAAVVVLLLTAGHAALSRLVPGRGARRWLGGGVVVVAAAALAAGTVLRNQAYRDDIRMYEDIVAKAPHNPRGHRNLGVALAEAGDLRRALRHLDKSIELKWHSAGAHTNRGVTLERLGRFDEALRSYRTALRIDPKFVEAHCNLASLLGKQRRYQEALDHYMVAIGLRKRDPALYLNCGVLLAGAGRSDLAVRHFLMAAELDPRLAMAYYNIGVIHARKGMLNTAEEHFRKAIRADPDHADSQYNLATALSQMGRGAEALPHYRIALRLRPDDALGKNGLARLLATCPDDAVRNGPEAVKLAEQACAATGQRNHLLLDTLAAAYAEVGRFGDAVATVSRAVELADEAKDRSAARQYRARLAQYRSGQPYRDAKAR